MGSFGGLGAEPPDCRRLTLSGVQGPQAPAGVKGRSPLGFASLSPLIADFSF